MPVVSKEIVLDTLLGELHIRAQITADYLQDSAVTITHAPIFPELVEGMSVFRCTAIVLTVEDAGPIELLHFSATLDYKDHEPCSSGPSTGQGFEAQEWSNNKAVLLIGTDDDEALNDRYPTLEFPPTGIAEYASDSITVRVGGIPQAVNPSLHFVVAENYLPEPVEDSVWFAANLSHAKVLSDMASLSGRLDR